MKKYTHCGESYKLKEKVAEFYMEGGRKYNIFKSDKKVEREPLFLMFGYTKVKSNLCKITDAYTFWDYWTTPLRQAWIIKRKDSKLWEEVRKEIERHKIKVKNKDVLPEIAWD